MTRTKSTCLTLIAVLLSPMGANADPIQFFAETQEATIVSSFTFWVDDANDDGIITASEIFDFSGLTCFAGNFCSDTGSDRFYDVLGILGIFESTLNLSSLIWETNLFGVDSLVVDQSSGPFGGVFSSDSLAPSEAWVVTTGPEPATLEELIGSLSSAVMAINLQAGISNSLDAKLSSALSALDDANTNNDVAALNSMYAFCNSVQAQRGKKLTDTQSDELIAAANSVISALDEFASLCDL